MCIYLLCKQKMATKDQFPQSESLNKTNIEDCIISLRSTHTLSSLFKKYRGKSKDKYTYNISHFIRNYRKQPEKVIRQIDIFIHELDKRVHIDAHESLYKSIYDDTETIVKRLCEKLKQSQLCYKNAHIRRTGSIESNVKVGLPHE